MTLEECDQLLQDLRDRYKRGELKRDTAILMAKPLKTARYMIQKRMEKEPLKLL